MTNKNDIVSNRIHSVIKDEDGFYEFFSSQETENLQAIPLLKPPLPNRVNIILTNATASYQLIRVGASGTSGKMSCSTGNGYCGPNSVVNYKISNTFTSSLHYWISYTAIFTVESSSVESSGDFTINISGILSKTPANGYISINSSLAGVYVTTIKIK